MSEQANTTHVAYDIRRAVRPARRRDFWSWSQGPFHRMGRDGLSIKKHLIRKWGCEPQHPSWGSGPARGQVHTKALG